MDILLNIDSWSVINKWCRGNATFHTYRYTTSLYTAIQNGYLGLIKAKFSDLMDISKIVHAIYANQYEIVKWMCETYKNEVLPDFNWYLVQSLEIAELIYPRINISVSEQSDTLTSTIILNKNIDIVYFLHEKGWRTDLSYLFSKWNQIYPLEEHNTRFSYETVKLLQKYYSYVPYDILIRLEDTQEASEFLLNDPEIRRRLTGPENISSKIFYKIGAINLQILKMYHQMVYPVVNSYWNEYHLVIRYDRLDVANWLWEIGLTFDMEESLIGHIAKILIECKNALENTHNKTVTWLLTKPSFIEFINRHNLRIDSQTMLSSLWNLKNSSSSRTYAEKLKEVTRNLRLCIDNKIKLKNKSYAVSLSFSIAINMMLMRQYTKKHTYIINSVKNSKMWLFVIRFDHHFRTVNFSKNRDHYWVPLSCEIEITPLLILTEIIIRVMTHMHDGNTIIKWYYYNMFYPYAKEKYHSINLDRISSELIQPLAHDVGTPEQYYLILVEILKLGNYEHLTSEMDKYISRSQLTK